MVPFGAQVYVIDQQIKQEEDPIMSTEGKMVCIELSEHDASKLVALIRQEITRTDKAWRPYWLRVAQDIQQGIEHAGFRAFLNRSVCRSDMSDQL
jgi:hypothetical protein